MVRRRRGVPPSNREAGDDLGQEVHFTARDATLVAESERCFRTPRVQDNPPSGIGGIGQHNILYGLNIERAAELRELLGAYINAPDLTRMPREVVESRKRRLLERLERWGACRQLIRSKGYRCEACEWSIEEDEQEVWGSSFEFHHFGPFHELRENETRVVCIQDFAVLCASCHRAIHRTELVSDVADFVCPQRPAPARSNLSSASWQIGSTPPICRGEKTAAFIDRRMRSGVHRQGNAFAG